ncbi:hypothetical protein AAC387_Pa08g1345 [Persea americana]
MQRSPELVLLRGKRREKCSQPLTKKPGKESRFYQLKSPSSRRRTHIQPPLAHVLTYDGMCPATLCAACTQQQEVLHFLFHIFSNRA